MNHLPLRTVKLIRERFIDTFNDHQVVEYKVDDFESVFVLDDSLVLAIVISEDPMPVCLNAEEIYRHLAGNPHFDIPERDGTYYVLYIEELTFNEINYKHNHAAFCRGLDKQLGLKHLHLDISYTKFRGYTRLYWAPEQEMPIESYDRKIPQLRLKERYEQWQGVQYHFIVIELENLDGLRTCVVAYTTTNPHIYIRNFCKTIITNKRYTAGEFVRGNHKRFEEYFISWKRESVKERLENHLSYFILEEFHKEKDSLWRRADQINKEYLENKYSENERSTYLHPVNKWVSEELMYNLICKIFKRNNVIYQHRPFFLKSSFGGQMSYDVFVPKWNLAFEYQGQQHFEPIEFFGGEDSFVHTQTRDLEKKQLSEKNGIHLVYINYWENLTKELIVEKIRSVLPEIL